MIPTILFVLGSFSGFGVACLFVGPAIKAADQRVAEYKIQANNASDAYFALSYEFRELTGKLVAAKLAIVDEVGNVILLHEKIGH